MRRLLTTLILIISAAIPLSAAEKQESTLHTDYIFGIYSRYCIKALSLNSQINLDLPSARSPEFISLISYSRGREGYEWAGSYSDIGLYTGLKYVDKQTGELLSDAADLDIDPSIFLPLSTLYQMNSTLSLFNSPKLSTLVNNGCFTHLPANLKSTLN